MKRAMISCPMNGLSEFDVELRQRRATEWLQNNGYWIAHSFISTPVPVSAKHKPVWYLAKSLETMCEVDAVFFCKGWENARGCILEHEICKKYGIPCLYEHEDETVFEQLTLDMIINPDNL